MSLKNILRSLSINSKKDDKKDDRQKPSQMSPIAAPAPEFTFIRSDTFTQDIIRPPSSSGNSISNTLQDLAPSRPRASSNATTRSRFRSSFQNIPVISSHRRSKSSISINIPQDLPQVNDADPDREAQWEKRATVLVGCPNSNSFPAQSASFVVHDENIQEAIRLHEAGEYERSTAMFGRLADPRGANNALSQVLYGLALRHGWGIETDPEKAVTYLQSAAKNSAAVEEEALRAGMKKGGRAKGELVLAIYELGNSYRQGWGVEKDPIAAREYYETAANLGDSDAQNEVAWCYLEGFGCKKDKKKAARFYRMAEKQGNKIIGNSWIYKEKYMGK